LPRIRDISRRKIATVVGVLALLGGGIALTTGTSNAAESCQGLDTALQNNLNFIAGQKANPDANSAGRITNRQAVVDLIQQRRDAAGCTNKVKAQKQKKRKKGRSSVQGSGENCAGLDKALQNNLKFIAGQKANPDANSAGRITNRQAVVDLIQQRRDAAGCKGDGGEDTDAPDDTNAPDDAQPPADQPAEQPAEDTDENTDEDGVSQGVVCKGSTVTLSGEAGAPAASSGTFKVGTKLKVTNLDNNKSITVKVASASGSCVLLNNAAFEKVREPGKFLIRKARIEKVG
jgi:hypothetical protein